LRINILQVDLAPGETLPPQLVAALEGFRGNGHSSATSNTANGQAAVVTDDMVRAGLTRKALHPAQKRLLSILYRADDFLGADDICQRMNVSRLQLTGTMGGLGLRYRAVRGWPNKRNGGGRPTRALFEHERRDRQDFYKMTDQLRGVIRAANIVD
jgi:hypothetical protein